MKKKFKFGLLFPRIENNGKLSVIFFSGKKKAYVCNGGNIWRGVEVRGVRRICLKNSNDERNINEYAQQRPLQK